MEKDGEELNGVASNQYTTMFRQYDPRLGKWTSLDPLMAQFPHTSPFAAFANNPIYFTDPYGLAPTNDDEGSVSDNSSANDGDVNDRGGVYHCDAEDASKDGFVYTLNEVTASSSNSNSVPSSEIGANDANTGDMTGNAYKGTLSEYNTEFGTNYETHQEAANTYYNTDNLTGYDPNWIKEFDRSIDMFVYTMYGIGGAAGLGVVGGAGYVIVPVLGEGVVAGYGAASEGYIVIGNMVYTQASMAMGQAVGYVGTTTSAALGTAGTFLLKQTGGLKQWFRPGPSFSHSLGTTTNYSLRWGASWTQNFKYVDKIGNNFLMRVNMEIRGWKFPTGNLWWRSADPGHFHLGPKP